MFWLKKKHWIDSMATFIAAYITTLPEAQSMDPSKLQRALPASITLRLCFSISFPVPGEMN